MKKLILTTTFILALSLSACSLTGSTQVNTQVTPTAAPKANVFTSIKDALSKSLSLKCEYTDPTSKTTVTAYIKNGAVRVGNIVMDQKNKGNAIMKDNKMWIWSDSNKQGMYLELNQTQTKDGSTTKTNQQEEVINSLEQNKQSCKPEVVADSMFTAPTDVEFSDLSKLMQNSAVPNISVTETPAE